MRYLDRIATETPAALIAAEAPGFLEMLRRDYPTVWSPAATKAQASRNRAYVEAVAEELRGIWRQANVGDETWRPALIAFAARHPKVDNVAGKRWTLIAERCGKVVA